ncbi:MAG: dethiobiotin synthase [Gammaproteobacteria bacterium]|nr:dethiobiotin synthase [Gammaproteobacteria bacterium]
MKPFASGFFITGTDTDVGKTEISLGLIKHLQDQGMRVAAMKPIASGCTVTTEGLRNADALRLQQAASQSFPYATINPYAFEAAIAPHIAARNCDTVIDLNVITQQFKQLQQNADLVIVEGAGGWRVPINEFQDISDLAAVLQLPVILVVGMRLGCINHALLSAEAISQRGLPFWGWIANQIDPNMPALEENIATLQQRLEAPLLGKIPYLKELTADRIAVHFDLRPLMAIKPPWLL